MQLEPTRSSLDLFNETRREARIALGKKPEIHGKSISGLEHSLNMPRPWRAGRSVSTGCRSCSSTHHCSQARVKGFFDLLRADVMNMCVDAAGSNNLSFACDRFSSWPNNDVNIRLHIWVTSFPDGRNTTIPDRDIGLHNSPVVKNHGVGDDCIHGSLVTRALRLAHAITNDLPASELHFVTVDGEVVFHLNDDVRVCKAQLVTNCWTKHLRVRCTIHSVWHSEYLSNAEPIIPS